MLGPIEWVDEVDSTNRVLLDRARAGEPEGVVLAADHQTAGRGRLGRTWEAPPGASVLVSVLLRPALPMVDAHLVTAAAAVAAVEACAEVAGVPSSVKWPNDLVVEGEGGTRKLAGLLAESLVEGDRLVAVVIGMGLNVNWPTPLPPELAGIATALNHEAGRQIDRHLLLDAWVAALDRRYASLADPAQRLSVAVEHRRACSTIGRRVRVELVGDVLEGTALDVDDGGRLVVDADGTRHTVSVGDVVHLRDA